MKKVLLTVAYNGKAYHGYQLQEDLPTVSLMLNKAICSAFSLECNVTGCSRTDAGVHAKGFVANFKTNSSVPPNRFREALNTKLPAK